MKLIPLDIPSFDLDKHDEFMWPISYEKYDFLSYGFVDKLLNILDNQEGDVKTALTCKLSDILIDIAHIVRQAIEIQEIRKTGNDIIYDIEASPTIGWLLGRTEKVVRHNNCRSFRDNALIYARFLKRILSGSAVPSGNIYNAVSINYLMKEHISAENLEVTNMLVEFYLRSIPSQTNGSIDDISFSIYDALKDVYEFDYQIEKAVKEIVEYHMKQALGDIEHLKKSSLRKALGRGMVSGTPKYEGRILSWYFQDNGKDVIRHAHGGERVFYKDYVWPIAELPFCSAYYTHSKTEAINIKSRIDIGEYAAYDALRSIKFTSLGSVKHKNIYKNSMAGKKQSPKAKTIIYVTGVYLGDLAPNLPSFKIPDSLYFDFQIRLLKFLKSEGWRIIIKPHPKGLYNPAKLLEPYADEVVIDKFDPNNFNAEVFLFDFAGTAFFDTLFSAQKVVLLNLGHRPFDDGELGFLEKRCSVLNHGFDECGRVAMDKDRLLNAIENVPLDGCLDDFVERYAG